MDDNMIVDLYFQRSERAITETAAKYGNYCYSIAFNILNNNEDADNIEIEVGSVVQINYTGGIMESYPAQINATSWKLSNNFRHLEYTEEWLDTSTATKYDNNIFDHIIITKIYSNCFFAETVIPMTILRCCMMAL